MTSAMRMAVQLLKKVRRLRGAYRRGLRRRTEDLPHLEERRPRQLHRQHVGPERLESATGLLHAPPRRRPQARDPVGDAADQGRVAAEADQARVANQFWQ